MNKQFVKNIYEKTPSGIKRLFSRTIRNRLINNKVFRKQYDLLVRAEQMTNSEVDTIQQQELKKICIYAYENCDFYKNEFDKNGFNPYDFTVDDFIGKVPIIDKNIVLNNIEGINSRAIDDSYEAVTGGSSGKRLVVNTTMECLYKEYAFVYHHYTKFTKSYDYKRSSLAYIGGYGDTLISENPLYAMRIYNSMQINNETILKVVKDINLYKPEFIRGLPSAIYFFCKLIKLNNLKIGYPVDGIILQSENIYPYQSEAIKDVFDCEILTHYGHTERVVFGEQQLDEKGLCYRFNKLYGYTELANDGRIISTGFINYKMPLVRYATDDYAELVAGDLYKIRGHREKTMYGKHGELVSLASFTDTSAVFDKIEKYQFVQEELGHVLLRIVPAIGLTEQEYKKIHEFLNEKAQGVIDFSVQSVDDIEYKTRGKFDLLIQKVSETAND